MTQPGTLAHNMRPGQDALGRRVRDLERALREGLAGNAGQAMQIGAGGILVNGGGSITIEGGGSLNVSSGVLNTAGQITTSEGVTAAGAVESGNGAGEIDASGNIIGASLDVSGEAAAGSLDVGAGNFTATAAGDINMAGAASVGGALDVTGQVSATGTLRSVGSYGYAVATSYKAVWIDGATYQLGYSPSSQVVKTSLAAMGAADAQKLLNVTPYWGRYVWDDPAHPLRVFLLAGDVQAAGFGPDVAPVVEGADPLVMVDTTGSPIIDPTTGQPCTVPAGDAYTINYSQLVVPLVAAYQQTTATIQAMQAQITALQAQVAALTPPATA